MKISVQVLAGVVAGALLALLLPIDSFVLNLATGISTTILSIGRYIVLPLLFFSLVISVSQLQRKKILFKNFLKIMGITVAFTLGLVIIGIVSSIFFSPGQVPVVIDGIRDIHVPNFEELVKISFPDNIFSIFQGDFSREASQFVPFFVLALLLGIFFTKSSREEVEPTYNLIDSLSRIFYKINLYFLQISFVWITILTATYITLIKNIIDLEIFLSLSIMLLSIAIFVVFLIYPIIFYYTCGRRNPFKYIAIEFTTLITAITTGDLFFTGVALIPSQKKDFKINREYSGFNIPFLTLFSKAGTALVTVISFIVILKSYSSLEVTASQILFVGSVSFIVSFCLPTKAVGGSIASLYLLCSLYGYGGIEDSFIILSPIFPILAAISTLLNSATIILINIIMDPEKRLAMNKKK